MISYPEIIIQLQEARNILVQYMKINELRIKLIETCNDSNFPLQEKLEELLDDLIGHCSKRISDNQVIFDIRVRACREEEKEKEKEKEKEEEAQQWEEEMREDNRKALRNLSEKRAANNEK